MERPLSALQLAPIIAFDQDAASVTAAILLPGHRALIRINVE